ncbi:trinucleotide repeat-containing gene 6C protein isoform X1 [Anguilla anguilla]|uniref:trinucleotide repeat-containing gene 6C protein isoform X1 n=1 Tax=Anguilla anguilla TaxID=7936 RepID=UPI0015A835F0|nr:trinucleotide repeat-containing gene 6C protein isoform X1 [Anguilla anguilla]
MEEKKKKKQEEKKKKDSAQKKAAEPKTKVPESAKPSPSPPQPADPSASPPVPAASGSGNGKRAPGSAPQPQQQQQQQQPTAAPRYPPREVPPRFRQHEHKQLLKRGQPLPAGGLPLAPAQPGTLSPPHSAPGLAQPSSKRHAELPLPSGLGAQYESPRWGGLPPTSQSQGGGWDQVIIDESDTEAWPSISRGDSHAPPGCAADTERAPETSGSSSSSSSASMSTGGAQQGHFPAHHPGSKAGAGHSGSAGPGQGGASRGWGSGPAHCPPGEGKADGPAAAGGRGQPCWSSSSFNLNLNPNANPAAWPVLGHEAGSMGGSNGPPPSPNLCSPAGTPPAPGSNGNTGSANGNGGGGAGGAWGDVIGPDAPEPHPCPSTNVSFSAEPQNLNTDGPNHTKQEPPSPAPSLPSWGGLPAGMGSLAPPPGPASQVNGEGGSVWGNGADAKPAGPKDSGWDSAASAWGRGGNGGGAAGAWGRAGGGDWGGKHSGEAKGWEAAGSPPQEQPNSWSRPAPAAASDGSSDSQEGRAQRRDRTPGEEAPPPPLPRPDLDPRVLCNTGWGQTPVRQHTVWDMEEASRAERKGHSGTEAWGGAAAPPSGAPGPNGAAAAAPRPDSGGKAEGPVPGGWGAPAPAPPAPPQPGSGWGEQPAAKKVPNGSGGWGDAPPGGPNASAPKASQSWGPEEKSPSWDDTPAKPKAQSWGEGPKPSHGWGSGGGGSGGEWAEPGEGKRNGTAGGPWEGEAGSWKDPPRGWGKSAPGSGGGGGGGGGWGEGQRPAAPPQSWGGKPQDGPSANGNGGVGGGAGSWGGPTSVKQSGSGPGWGGTGPGGGGAKQDPGGEPTGWEEPSPPSIRRKMEIDDGTSTWGDPTTYNKTVNMWDRNNPVVQSTPGPNANPNPNPNPPAPSNNNNNHNHHHHHHHHHHHPHHPHHNQPPAQSHGNNNNGSPNAPAPHQPGPPPNRPPLVAPGWGELPSAQPKPEPSWGEPPAPAAAVDNGTSAWGKPPGSSGTWGEGGHDGPGPGPGPYGRGGAPPGSAPCKPAPKPMQDGWGGGGEDLSLSAGQWEPDDGDMWNSTASQESNSSCSSWGNPPKKGPPKGKGSTKQDDAWIMSRLLKQLTDMGFPRDPAEEALKSNNMNLDQAMSALLEKKTELDKRGMGISDYNNGLVSKALGCRAPAISKESSADRTPFLDKDGGLAEDAPTSPFMPSPSLKLPLSSTGLPSQGLGGVASGLAMQNLNNRQMQSGMFGSSGAAQARAVHQQAPPPQPSVPPLNSSQPNLRAQVPQFLSPQVQTQLLQFAAKNIGLNPALLTSPINPQQMTLLYQLQQLQMAYQRLQIQQQMMQGQRPSGPIRQQEQQVARTINNMQQQIQQHQRQLAQALLMKQQPPPPPPSHSSLQPSAGKSALDGFPGHAQGPGLSDLQTKEPQSSPNSYAAYPLSGLNPNMNVNCMEVGGVSMKDAPQPQSRLSQWTHPNSMENLSGNPSPLEPNLNKHGAIPTGASLALAGKPPMDDSYSPYNLMPTSESPASPLAPPDSWGPGKGASEKISNGTNISWPPEFCPGVPWKGLQNIDPETDPNMTPGSVPSGPTINTNIQDVNRYLLRDRSGGASPTSQNGALPPSSDWPVSAYTSSFSLSSSDSDGEGKLSDMKSTWSPGPISHTQASLSHELWKVPQGPPRNTTAPSRPPPGLTNAKPSSTWGGNALGLAPSWTGSYSSAGTTWSTDSSSRTSSWLVLRNLTPQIDGSTLRTLCMQHGPLITFHLNLTQGNAVVRYSSKEEAAKAQKSLHMCVLGNTTILAEFAGEEEVNRFFAQGQSLTPTTSWQPNPGTNQTRLGGAGAAAAAAHAMGHWNSGGLGGAKAGSDLLWGGVQQYSGLWGPPSGEDARVIGSPTPINTLLPGDLLSGESM